METITLISKKIMKWLRLLSSFFLFFLFNYNYSFSQELINLTNGSVLTISDGAIFTVNGSININQGAKLEQNGNGTIRISNNFINNGQFLGGTGLLLFFGNGNSILTGIQFLTSYFYNITLDKDNPTNILFYDANDTLNGSLTITRGIFRFENNANRILRILGNLDISTNGTFDVLNSGTSRTHNLFIAGNITNNNVFDLNTGSGYRCNTTFIGNSNSIVTGTGGTTDFNQITTNKSSQSNEILINSNNFTALNTGFLTLNGGTFHLDGTFSINQPFFLTNSYSIPSNSGFWLDNPNAIVSGQNGDASLSGLLRISEGTMNVGIAATNNLLYSTGSQVTIEGGTLNIAGRFSRDNNSNSTVTYNQSSGIVNISTVGQSTAVDRGAFDIASSSSTFNWSGGIIELQRQSSNTSTPNGDYIVLANGGSVIGGILRINSSSATQTIRINSTKPVGELLMTGTNNPVVILNTNPLTVLGDITIAGTGSGRLNANNLNISLGGNWINNSTTDLTAFTNGTSRVIFNSNVNQIIGGSATTTFSNLEINKTAGKVILGRQTIINNNLYLISNPAILDISTFDIEFSTNSVIYSDNGSSSSIEPGSGFSESKCILYSETGTGGGWIRRNRTGNITSPTPFRFPLGTNGVYTPAEIIVNTATVGSGAYIRIKPIPQEQPNVQLSDISLKKYWILNKNNITLTDPPGGSACDVKLYYSETEVFGSEGNYHVLVYQPPWLIDPGTSSIVDFNTNLIYSERVRNAEFNGDWTAGEQQAAFAKYYSIADGNYNDPNSWSKVNFGGPVSNTAPSLATDRVFIGDGKTITLTANTPIANLIEVQNTGMFLTQTFTVNGDTFKLRPGGTLGIGDPAGITTGVTGNIRTSSRQFDTAGVYLYNGSGAQGTGNALPNRVRALIVQKPASDVLTLGNNVVIGDSLIINNGILTLGNYSANAENPNRTFIMRGGEIRIGLEFPLNYSPPTFTAGTVNFNGSVAFTVPSSGSTPGVLQYNNLTISGNKQYASITFATEGEIRISNVFDISSCTFNNALLSDRFLTTGSTISFNGNGNQNIPRTSGTAGVNFELSYHNLKLAGTGTKTLVGTVNHQVNNNVIIEGGSTFSLGTRDLTIRGNWINNGGNFVHSSRTVTFENNVALTEKTITSMGIPFHITIFNGPGEYLIVDTMTVSSLLQINSGGILKCGSASLRINGNWTNNNGTFSAGTGNVFFGGNTTNVITNVNGETFYNLIINKTANTVNLAANTNITIQNNLIFNSSAAGYFTFSNRANQYINLLGTATRLNLGHVDGNLRMFIPSGSVSSAFYPIGGGASYRPLFLTLNGTGGSAGFLQAQDSAYTVTPSGLNAAQYVQRRWALSIPDGSSFALGSRTANVIVTFLNPGDIRGGANPLLFETRLWNGSTWTKPTTGNRTTTTTQSLGYSSLTRTFWLVVGPPTILSFYSIANGNWNSASSWSTARYSGETSPTAPTSPSIIYIGDGKTITLNVNYNTTSANDSVIIETAGPTNLAGRLNLGTNTITGSGNFALRNGGILAIANTSGIMSSGASGNVQTAVRNFNEGGHNNGNFIYYASSAQNTGSGLPATVNTLILNNPTTVSLTNDVVIRDSLFIETGTFNSNGRDISIGGNWRNNGTFVPGTRTVTINGNGLQNIIRTTGETFYNLVINKSSGVVRLVDSVFITNQLTFTNGIIDARTNNRFVSIASGGTVTRTSGHVDGELRRFIPSGNPSAVTYDIGTSDAYNPAIIDFNGTGGTAGHVSIIVYGTNHPNINNLPLTLDTTKNVQRYWRIFRPLSSPFIFGTRNYDLTLQFLNPDDLRGGSDPLNFVIRRWDGSWNNTTNGTRTSTTTQAVNITTFGQDFVIGEPFAVTRVFYTRLSGAWNNQNNWSYLGYGGPPADDYPSTSADVVFIGNNNTITLDQDRTLASVTVEDNNGQGTLDFNNYNLLGNATNQFTLKSGGRLRITSPDGITASGATGNVRTAIRNYNFNNHLNGFFVFSGNTNQNTGNGIPDTLGYLEISNTGSAPNNLVTLSKNIRVRNNLLLASGRLSSNNLNIILDSNWINNSGNDAFVAGTGTVRFEKNKQQSIGGSFSTQFNNLTISKTGNNLSLDTNISINGNLDFSTNTLLVINDNDLTFGANSSLSGSPFSALKMIQSNGSPSSGRVIKEYTNGTGVTRNFTFPIGVGSNYNEAIINIGGDFNNASTALKLLSGLHPNRISGNNNMLSKYWNITTQGITNVNPANTNLSFLYQPTDVNGNQARYLPARFNAGWEVNLGTSRNAITSPMTIQGEPGLTGDWTAGEPNSFFTGRIFYSRQTNVNWNAASSWSNISHTGSASVYWPGQIFEKDTVLIANSNNIRFNQAGGVQVDSMRIGGTLAGSLQFDRSIPNKRLTILRNITVENNGTISEFNSTPTTDTLIVFGNFINNNTTANAIDLRPADNRFTFLVFSGSGNSIVSGGSGANGWRLSNVRLNKSNGLGDTLINLSTTFSRALNTALSADRRFVLGSGVYRHNNSDTAILCANGAGPFIFGPNTGIHLISGRIRFDDRTSTNSNTSIFIQGGILYVGNAIAEHFLYSSGTKFTITGGEMRVAGCFSRVLNQSYCDFNMSGGILRILTVGTSNSYGYYGFDLSNANSIFNWSGGTIVLTRNSDDVDYKVGATTFSVTGGTLQIGETDVYISGSSDFALGSPTAPIWNLNVKFTKFGVGPNDYRAVLFWDGDFTILNDLTIDANGCLDLNCNSFTIGGNFINRGNFTTDGVSWNQNVGARKVTFNGSGNQIYANLKPIVDHTGPSYNNQAFFDVEIDKPSGKIILDSAGAFANSNFIVRNTLKFSANNNAIIDARTHNRYVFSDFQSTGDLAQIQRLGKGHVNGVLRREVGAGAQSVEFIIGTDTAYTPAILDINGTGGTAGPLDMIVFNSVSPAPTDPPINLSKYLTRRWRISRPTGSSFVLGATRNFSLTTTFLQQIIPAGDVPTGASWTNFEHFVSRNAGAWNLTAVGTRTANTTQSINHTIFDATTNDFIIGERTAINFYSVANGNWTSPSTWSTVGYGGPPETVLFPNSSNHQVHIGDGKTVILNTDANVKSVTIEKVGAGPGHLVAGINFITGETFSLNDSCTISTAHQFGLRATLMTGSIRTNQRYFGRANYIFNSTIQTQNTGDGVPLGPANRVLSLTINNTASDSINRRVLLTSNLTSDSSIFLQSGFLDAGSRIVQTNRDLIINANSNYIPSLSTFEFINPILDQNITINNSWGTLFHNLNLSKANGNVILNGTSGLNIFVKNRLRFSSGNNAKLDVRSNNSRVILTSTGFVERIGGGYVDGKLRKPVPTGGGIYTFEIGNDADYTPAILTLTGSGGVSGSVEAENIIPLPSEPFSGNRMDQAHAVPRYWSLIGYDNFSMGGRLANVNLQFPPSELSTINLSNAVIRRRSIPAETPVYKDRRNLTWNVGLASVELAPAENRWTGLGEFYIGNKSQRIFYSRQNGDWDNNNSWSFTALAGPPVPVGEFPNPDWNLGIDETEVRDSVVIGNGYTITLGSTITPELASVEILSTGNLAINQNSYLSKSSIGISVFTLRNDGTLTNNTDLGIQTGLSGLIRFDDANRTFEPNANYVFSGSLNQSFGNAFPTNIGNLIINNDNNSRIVSTNSGILNISGNLNVNSGQLRPLNNTVDLRLAGNLTVNGILNFSIDPSGNNISSIFKFTGTNPTNQIISGSGELTFFDLVMNRNNALGLVQLNMNATVKGTLNFLEGANTNNQIIALGNNSNLRIDNTNSNAIQNYQGSGIFRYIRTSNSSGLLLRNVTNNQTYIFPIGSFDTGTDNYTPGRLITEATGSDGYIGMRVSRGSSSDPVTLDGHLYLPTDRTNSYIKRYWVVDSVTTTRRGQLRFDYSDNDIAGNENLITSIGRWRPTREGSPGSWRPIYGNVNISQNYFETFTSFLDTNYRGDWTIANIEAFRRLFFSRQSGNWTDLNSWTASRTHSGPIFGDYPQESLDSVNIGGGSLGVGNHVITLNIPSVTIAGVSVGRTQDTTGTLDCGLNIIYGESFTLDNYSTLAIGSPQGITLSGMTGNIQTNSRNYTLSGLANFVYKGNTDQNVGNGLPANVRSLTINNTGLTGNNTVSLLNSINILSNLSINSGRLDLLNFTANNNSGTGVFTLNSNATLRVGGTNNLQTAINNYSSYVIDQNSTIEFYGGLGENQTISSLPINLSSGLGNVILNNSGTKFVSSPLLIRGNLFNSNGAFLQNNAGVDALEVRGSIINSASINNDGVIEIGQ